MTFDDLMNYALEILDRPGTSDAEDAPTTVPAP